MAEAIFNDRFILTSPQDVQHDNSLSGNGTLTSPLGVQNPLPYPMEFVSTSSQATAQNVIYVVTGTNS